MIFTYSHFPNSTTTGTDVYQHVFTRKLIRQKHPHYLHESVAGAQHAFQVFAGHVFDALQRVPVHAHRVGAVSALLLILGGELGVRPFEPRLRQHVD